MNGAFGTFVLIPGAWHGGWAWLPVARRLRGAGHRAIALTLPGLAVGDDPSSVRLTDAVDHIVDEVVRRDLTDVTLVAHSWGAYPAIGAAHRLTGRVAKIVFFGGLIPVPGKSLLDDSPPEHAALLRGVIDSSPDHAVPITLEMVQQALMQDAAPQAQALLHELLLPQPGGYLLDPLEVPSLTPGGVSAAYILGDDDRALPIPGAEYARRLGVEPIMVPGSHGSLVTHPDEVTEALLGA